MHNKVGPDASGLTARWTGVATRVPGIDRNGRKSLDPVLRGARWRLCSPERQVRHQHLEPYVSCVIRSAGRRAYFPMSCTSSTMAAAVAVSAYCATCRSTARTADPPPCELLNRLRMRATSINGS